MADPATKLDHALAAAARGIPVFPLQPDGKKPLHKGWQDEATTDPAKIRTIWFDFPAANIGWAMGDGLLALDVDMKDGRNGESDLFGLTLKHDDLPESLVNHTTTGGRHIILKTETQVSNSAHRIAKGLDIRGRGGYVVGAGSTIKGKQYLADETQIAPAPQWLIALAGKSIDRTRTETPLAEQDTQSAIERATEWLQDKAEPAIQGDGGDATTYKTAAKLKDLGISETTALELMLDHWNDLCQPPWDPEELQRKIANAYAYGKIPAGANTAAAEFPPANLQTKTGETDPLRPRAPHGTSASSIPHRRFVLGHIFIRQKLSVLVAPPGAGKTTWTLLAALSIASGKPLLNFEVKERTKVWYYNNEDETEELDRRLLAAMQQYNITWDDLMDDQGEPMLFLNSGAERPLKIAKLGGHDGRRILPADTQAITEHIKAQNIGVFIADPFVELHDADENDNVAIGAVARILRQIGTDTDAAIGLIHHTRKAQQGSSEGHAGNADSGRGAGALIGVARVALTLYGMAEKDAKRHGIPERERNRYVRLDDAKANLSLVAGKPYWYERVGVRLGGPEGEDVGCLVPAQLTGIEVDEDGAAADFGQDESPMVRMVRAQFLDDEEVLRLPVLMARLFATCPEAMAGLSEGALRKRLTRILEHGPTCGGRILRLSGGRQKAGNLVFATPTNADTGEAAKAG